MATVSWTANSSGNWATGLDWSGGSVPNPADDVVIDTSSPFTITFNGPPDSIESLTVDDGTLKMTSSSLRVLGNTYLQGAFTESGASTTLTLGGSLSDFTGQVTQTGGAIQVGSGTLEFAGFTNSSNTLNGTISGGTVLFNSGSEMFGAKFRLATAGVIVGSAALNLAANLLYSGYWTETGGAINLNGHDEVLSGTALVHFMSVNGPGKLELAKNSAINSAVASGGVTVENKGHMTFLSQLNLDPTNAGIPTILNASGAVLTISGYTGYNDGGSLSGAPTVENQGSIIVSGAEIQALLINDGKIEIAGSGASFLEPVSGSGKISLDDGSTTVFSASVAAGISTTLGSFTTVSASPFLSAFGSGFAGTIANFAAGDVIVAGQDFFASTTLSFDQVHDVLQLTEGSQVGTLQLAGSYSASDFYLFSANGYAAIGHT